jgi:branched-subunit amino acid aminotransferase/4-amino-4-deoxychorismate lyase
MRHWVSLNGTLLAAEEARVSVFDAGFMQGIGLFETMRAYDGRIFRLQPHLDRLVNSARVLGWSVLPEPDDLEENVRQVVSATPAADTRVRLTVTTGSLHAEASDTPQLTVVATASPLEKHPDELYTQGVSVVISATRQNPTDPTNGHKTTSYFARLAALRAAHKQAAFEALWFTPDGFLAEGSISSVFVVRDEQLLTPPLDTPVLPGITRATLMEFAVALDIPVRELPLTLDDLRASEEMFLTNSMMEVLPVVRIAREPIGNEKIGETTRKLAVAYTELVNQECVGE